VAQRQACSRLDKNRGVNSSRSVVLGKRNWLCIGHPCTGPRSSNYNPLLVSRHRHGNKPTAYGTDVLRRLPALTNQGG
jgi:hypothetical protein